MAWLRRGGDYGENYHRLHNHAGETPAFHAAPRRRLPKRLPPPTQPRRRDACFLCFAERLKAMARHSPRGRLRQRLPPPAQPRRRDACFLCFAERLKAMARHPLRGRLWWKLPPPTQPTQARRLRSLLCRAPKGDGQASAACPSAVTMPPPAGGRLWQSRITWRIIRSGRVVGISDC